MAFADQRFRSVGRRRRTWPLIGCFCLAVLEAGVAGSAPLPPDTSAADVAASSLAVFQTGRTHDIRRSTWRADVVEVAGKPPAGDNPLQGFRTTIVVPDNARDAALCLDRQPGHKLYINGTLVGQDVRIAATPPVLKKYSDLGKYFHQGSNCIAVEAETHSRWGPAKTLLLEGAVRCTGRRIVRRSDYGQVHGLLAGRQPDQLGCRRHVGRRAASAKDVPRGICRALRCRGDRMNAISRHLAMLFVGVLYGSADGLRKSSHQPRISSRRDSQPFRSRIGRPAAWTSKGFRRGASARSG